VVRTSRGLGGAHCRTRSTITSNLYQVFAAGCEGAGISSDKAFFSSIASPWSFQKHYGYGYQSSGQCYDLTTAFTKKKGYALGTGSWRNRDNMRQSMGQYGRSTLFLWHGFARISYCCLTLIHKAWVIAKSQHRIVGEHFLCIITDSVKSLHHATLIVAHRLRVHICMKGCDLTMDSDDSNAVRNRHHQDEHERTSPNSEVARIAQKHL
jgi:hypothetical protein